MVGNTRHFAMAATVSCQAGVGGVNRDTSRGIRDDGCPNELSPRAYNMPVDATGAAGHMGRNGLGDTACTALV